MGAIGYQDNPGNILGANTADNLYVSDTVAANAVGSIIERMQYIQENIGGTGVFYGAPNYLAVPITFTALTTGSVATHEIFTVTGMVRVRIVAECTVNVAGSGTIELGVATDTDAFIATTTGTDIDAGELWYDATPTTVTDTASTVVLDKIVSNGTDIGYEVKSDTLTGGAITFHCWWEALNSTGAVVVADGTGTL